MDQKKLTNKKNEKTVIVLSTYRISPPFYMRERSAKGPNEGLDEKLHSDTRLYAQ